MGEFMIDIRSTPCTALIIRYKVDHFEGFLI